MHIDESKQILVAITELQTNMRQVITRMDEIGKVSNLALQTEQSTKSAHNRIDDLKSDVAEKLAEQKKDYEEKIAAECKAREKMEGHITWLWRTVGAGGIALMFWLLQQLINLGGQ